MARLDSIDRKITGWQNPRRIGHNTTAWCDALGSFGLRYHYTNVVSYDAQEWIMFISHAGWMTKTTAQRIDHGLRQMGLRLLTSDLPNRWRVADHKGNAWTIRGNSLRLHLDPITKEWSRHV